MTQPAPQYEDRTNIRSVWDSMTLSKGDLIERSKEYARWTLPHICPQDDAGNTEVDKANVFIGPRLVNFLANKIVNVLFPHDRNFFRIELSAEAEFEAAKTVAQEEIDASKSMIQKAGANVTKLAMRKLDLLSYRPMAIEAVKHTIITGNAVVRRMPSNKRVVYGIQDFGVFRNIDGSVYDAIVRDSVRFDSLDEGIQNRIRTHRIGVKDNDVVALFSRWRKQGKRWEFTQAVDDINLGTFSLVTDADMPLIFITWSLARAENYGRGLVEDNAASFSGLDVSTTALLDLFGIAADIKFLVNPGSVLDIDELLNSARGSYHYGNKDDVTSPEIGRQKSADINVLSATIERWERQLSSAFLMTSGTVRDAERVTAEEIRFYAQEIESAFGGLYSYLSMTWQASEADWALRQVDTSIPKAMDVIITTGMDLLSQEAQLENLRYALNDLGLLNAVPEDVRAELSTERIATFIFTNRNLPYDQFRLTQQERQARQEQQQQMMQAEAEMQTQQIAAQESAKAAAQETE